MSIPEAHICRRWPTLLVTAPFSLFAFHSSDLSSDWRGNTLLLRDLSRP